MKDITFANNLFKFMYKNLTFFIIHVIRTFFPLRFVIARLTRMLLIGKWVDRIFFHEDEIYFLPKDQVIKVHMPLEKPENIVLPTKVVEHFICRTEYLWVMDFCICRDSNGCSDYPHDLGCLFLGEAILKIDERLGRRVSPEEALEHVEKCNRAGLVHLIGRNRLDRIWLRAGPGHKLLTICHCCPCCCLWKMLPQLHPRISDKINKMPGVSVRVTDRCTKCGTCTKGICFVNSIHLNGNGAFITSACRGCGQCAMVCPHGAIEITIDGKENFVESTIDRIDRLVDLS